MRSAKAEKRGVTARENVIRGLQGLPEYERLFAEKDAALRAWNRLDAWKNSMRTSARDLELAELRVSRALRALEAYEDLAFSRAARAGAS